MTSMIVIFTNSFSKCLTLILICIVSKTISFSEEDEPIIEYTHPPAKLKYDYGNVSTKLVIFDTDNTIWPFCTQSGNISLPLTKMQGDVVVDKKGNQFRPFPQINDVFLNTKIRGHKVGIIAQNPNCDIIYKFISLFEFGKYVDYKACFVGPKKDLVRKLHQESSYSYDDILYLDDEYYEITDVMELNATALLASEVGGVIWDDVQRGLDIFTMVGPWSIQPPPEPIEW